MPSEGGTFGTPFAQEPPTDDIFAALAEFASASDRMDMPFDQEQGQTVRAQARQNVFLPSHRRAFSPSHLLGLLLGAGNQGRFSRVQKVLVAGIIALGATLVYVLVVKTPSPSSGAQGPDGLGTHGRDDLAAAAGAAWGNVAPVPSAEPAWDRDPNPDRSRLGPNPAAQVAGLAPATRGRDPLETERQGWDTLATRAEPPVGTQALPSPESLSLQLADRLYQRRDFESALAMYDKLYRQLPTREENQPVRDFLLLRMALCCRGGGHPAQADTMLRTISMSRLPILRALARYHQGTTLLSRQRYWEAAAQAYQTLALIEVANDDTKWVSAVQQQCGLLAAEAVTRNLLALCDADANLPPELWSPHPDIDPFVEMEESRLRVFLAAGAESLEAALLSPQIHRLGSDAVTGRWSVTCNGAPLEELLARFAANAGVNVRWADAGAAPASPVRAIEENVRARPVYLHLVGATALQVVTTAAGSVGLIAQADDRAQRTEDGGQSTQDSAVVRRPSAVLRDPSSGFRLLDPTSYSSLAEHTNLLAHEAITLWQRFLLRSQNDPRAAKAHFAIALLQAARGQFDEAIAEYRLVANQYPRGPLAPHALLRSGTLKVRLRDYLGAQMDLKQLMELYPETELADRACLYLADATMRAGLYEEATSLYRKVYNLGLSAAAQTESALGVGRCLYEIGQHEEAAKWLSRYVTLVRDRSRPEFSAACLLLGKACLALHRPQQAQAALNLAIQGELSRQQHVETIALLVKTCIEQGLFLEALTTLEGTSGWQLSQQEGVDLAVLRAQALRAIGLVDKATALLEEKGQYLSSPELQAKVALELTCCHLDDGHLERARKTLGEAFATVGPGPLAGRIGRELASVCLRLGQTAQAVSICTQLLEHADAAARQPILTLLADAYRRQGKYHQALVAMLDRYEAP